MRLKLILPRQIGVPKAGKAALPPLGLAMIAALTPPDIEVSITDENIADIDFDNPPDLVGISTVTWLANRAYQIADFFRGRGTRVILGGIHPSVMPQEAIAHADSVVIGEAEDVWKTVIEDFKSNSLKSFYKAGKLPDLADIPIPRRDLFARDKYLLPNTVFATRGCPFSCSFCSVAAFSGNSFRFRPIKAIIDEIERMPGKLLFILDDNINGNAGFARDLFRSLVPYRKKWIGQASVTIARDEELLRLAARSGCIFLEIGFESISQSSLASVGKRANLGWEYKEVAKRIHAHGISIYGSFIFGFDDDEEDVFEQTVEYARKMRLDLAQFDFLTPYPGTPLRASLEKEGRLLPGSWSNYGCIPLFKPRKMTPEILQKGHDRSYLSFYSIFSIWRRIGMQRNPLRLVLLWALNLFFRHKYRNAPSPEDLPYHSPIDECSGG